MSVDRVCFGMPKDREKAMVAVPVIQDYIMQIKRQIERGQRPSSEYEVWVHWPDDPMRRWFHKLLWDAKCLTEYAPVRGEWDYAFQFDFEVAYELSLPTQRPAVETFGILSGASPPIETPVLKGVRELERIGRGKSGKIAVMSGPEQKETLRLLRLHRPEIQVWGVEERLWDVDNPDFDLKAMVDSVRDASLVIGRRSWQTAVVGGMDKFLLEFYPTDVHEKWFSKWGTKKYQLVYAQEFPRELIWAGLEAVWDRWINSILPA